jgi:hypothetical protein
MAAFAVVLRGPRATARTTAALAVALPRPDATVRMGARPASTPEGSLESETRCASRRHPQDLIMARISEENRALRSLVAIYRQLSGLAAQDADLGTVTQLVAERAAATAVVIGQKMGIVERDVPYPGGNRSDAAAPCRRPRRTRSSRRTRSQRTCAGTGWANRSTGCGNGLSRRGGCGQAAVTASAAWTTSSPARSMSSSRSATTLMLASRERPVRSRSGAASAVSRSQGGAGPVFGGSRKLPPTRFVSGRKPAGGRYAPGRP